MPIPSEETPLPIRRVVIDEPPPFLGTWKRVYVGVLIYLALLILTFYLFSRAYSP